MIYYELGGVFVVTSVLPNVVLASVFSLSWGRLTVFLRGLVL